MAPNPTTPGPLEEALEPPEPRHAVEGFRRGDIVAVARSDGAYIRGRVSSISPRSIVIRKLRADEQ